MNACPVRPPWIPNESGPRSPGTGHKVCSAWPSSVIGILHLIPHVEIRIRSNLVTNSAHAPRFPACTEDLRPSGTIRSQSQSRDVENSGKVVRGRKTAAPVRTRRKADLIPAQSTLIRRGDEPESTHGEDSRSILVKTSRSNGSSIRLRARKSRSGMRAEFGYRSNGSRLRSASRVDSNKSPDLRYLSVTSHPARPASPSQRLLPRQSTLRST